MWKNIKLVKGVPQRRYLSYTNELDCLSQRQVVWAPYDRDEIDEADLSELCTRDSNVWRAVTPLIFFVFVERHLPTRVLRQFHRKQYTPPHAPPTEQALHKLTKRQRFTELDRRITHAAYLLEWQNRETMEYNNGAMHRDQDFFIYLQWLHGVARVKLRPNWDIVPIAEVDSSDEGTDEYDEKTRAGVQPERAPLQAYMGHQVACLTNEAVVALARSSGRRDGPLESLAKTVIRTCRKLSMKIGCYTASTVPLAPRPQGLMVDARRGAARPSGRRAAPRGDRGKGCAEEDNGDDDSSNDDQDYINTSQLQDAPQTQGTQGDVGVRTFLLCPQSVINCR